MIFLACAFITVVDGDTLHCGRERVRLLGDGAPNVVGFDTPEIFHPRCKGERAAGLAAKRRMAELVKQSVGIEDSGKRDRYGRILGRLILKNGKTAGHVMLAEGYARVWRPGKHIEWCTRR